ncbi:ribonuclease H-like domain-containing protein [Tanacetum coccineum]
MPSHDQQWYMDTEATSHLSSHTGNLQTSFLNRNFHSVIVGNGSSISATHYGHVQIPNSYRTLHLENVIVTPNIIKNLVSVRKFTTDNKCFIDFDPYGFIIRDYHTRQTLLRCDSTGDLYPLHIAASAFALLTNNHYLWHQRLGHPGDNVIQTLSSRGLVSYNKQNTQHLCRACQLGKQTKLPFQRSTSIVTSPFDIIHSDLWTSLVSSMSGYKYYVLFLDHYSHFLWVYPLHRKSDAQSKLLHFRAFVKTQFNREIKAFQCDHGGEFDNNSLHELFATNGIQFHFSCPYTSQQNGKSERMIRTINNVVCSLLFQARLPPEYWFEALLTVAYLLNIHPSISINNDIPYAKLFNKPTSYIHLRTFGCLCYPYTFPSHKLAPRTTPSIFLGYPYNHHGYRCLDLNTNKIIISRHVTFDETVFPFGFMTPIQPPSYQFLDDNLDTSPIALRLLTIPTSPQQTPPHKQPHKQHHKQHFKTESSLFIFYKGPDTAYLLLYVDDIILTASSTLLLQRIISLLHAEFAMTDLGPLNYFLSISATRTTFGIFSSQTKYATEILERAQMLNCNPCRTSVDTEKKLGPEGSSVTDPILYRSLAGALQYLTFTRPDLSYAVQQLCLYMHDPREPHLNAMKRVLRYLRGTTDLGLQLFRSNTSQLIAYSDADWADTLSRSCAETEYRGVANAVAETSWIRNLLRELHTPLFTATLVYCDNVSAVYMSANPVQHQRTKHIEIDIHFVRDKVAAGHVRVLHVPSRFQYADIFTKGLPYPLFTDFRSSLSVRKSPAPTAYYNTYCIFSVIGPLARAHSLKSFFVSYI